MAPPDVPADGIDAMNYLFAQCGLSSKGRATLIEDDGEGINSMVMLSMLREKDISEMLQKRAKSTAARGGFGVPMVAQRQIAALRWWILEKMDRGFVPDPNEWNLATARESIQTMDDKEGKKKTRVEIEPPSDFDPKFWIAMMEK